MGQGRLGGSRPVCRQPKGRRVEVQVGQRSRRVVCGTVRRSGSFGLGHEHDWRNADARFAGAALDDAIRRAVNQDPYMAAEWISSNRDQPHLKKWMFEHAAGQNGPSRSPSRRCLGAGEFG